MRIPTVAIIGRPNVGKSTLFNVMTGSNTAVTDDIEGTTRDRIFKKVETPEIDFFLVDTGGIIIEKTNRSIEQDVQRQALMAIGEADIILFVVSKKEELLRQDLEIARMLRKKNQEYPILMVINKCDDTVEETELANYYQSGIAELMPISATHRRGTKKLMQWIVSACKKKHFITKDDERYQKILEEDTTKCHIAIVGKPNVGKSSLVNAWLNQERVIVSNVPGTTRDAIDSPIRIREKKYNLIDTAGIRRAGKIKGLDKYSTLRTLAAIERCDIAVLVIDSSEPLSHQDQQIAHLITTAKKGMVLLANKWDLYQKSHEGEEEKKRQESFLGKVKAKFAFLPWVSVVFTSAKDRKNITKLFEIFNYIKAERSKRIETGILNQFLQQMVIKHLPTGTKNIRPKFYYLTQVGINPPHFVAFVNKKKYFHFSYMRYMENQLRMRFGFTGTSIAIDLREKQPDNE